MLSDFRVCARAHEKPNRMQSSNQAVFFIFGSIFCKYRKKSRSFVLPGARLSSHLSGAPALMPDANYAGACFAERPVSRVAARAPGRNTVSGASPAAYLSSVRQSYDAPFPKSFEGPFFPASRDMSCLGESAIRLSTFLYQPSNSPCLRFPGMKLPPPEEIWNKGPDRMYGCVPTAPGG